MMNPPGRGALTMKNTPHTHIFLNKITYSSYFVADMLVLVNFDEITICSLFNAQFIRCFMLICTARVIDCKHRSQ